jgi:hypothetical protein
MDFKILNKCMILIQAWRSRKSKEDIEYPDSRDPELKEIMQEFGVVPQDLEKSMVVLAVWREAGEDIYQKYSVITNVIKNRQVKGLYRSHLCISDLDQFPSMTNENDHRLRLYPTESENLKKLLDNLDNILEGKTVDITQGATYFGVVGEVMELWFRNLIESGRYERTVQVAGLTFFREKK